MINQALSCLENVIDENKDVEIDVWAYNNDIIRNKDIQDKVRVNSMVDKTREERLKWFIHVKKRRARQLNNELWEGCTKGQGRAEVI